MSLSMLRTFFYGTLGLVFLLSCASAKESSDSLDTTGDEVTVVLRQTAMPEMAGDRLSLILDRYYKEGLGGPENWDKVVSLRVAGRLTLEGGEFEFDAYQKKPHYIKMTIHGPRRNIRMGYDGSVAWQVLQSTGPTEMDAAQSRRFMHGARFGNHLLYPYAHGKTMEYLDTVPVDGAICHQIRVTLDTEYQVDYFVDIRTYLEIKVVNTDLRTGEVSSVVYEDYIREFGMPIAKKVVSTENGVWVSTLELDEVKVNSGVMPWMFKMPK